MKYYPYGATREGGSKEKYLFTGQEHDSETGLYYYGARYYSPEVRRFVQADPVIMEPYDPQYLNRYSYVLNNPLMYNDPTGREPNKAQMGSVSDITLFNSLSDTRAYYDNPANHRNPDVQRYVYTIQYGHIDMYHFFDAAQLSKNYDVVGAGFAMGGGELLEVGQGVCGAGVEIYSGLGGAYFPLLGEDFFQNQWKSAFSYEDTRSNAAGAMFGLYLLDHPDKSFEENFKAFMGEIGVQEVNKESWNENPSQAPNWYSNLPEQEDIYVEPVERRTPAYYISEGVSNVVSGAKSWVDSII
ncbi:MAG: hypothetical protein A7316_02205 [Candidatus Altiarchaeales archaeon WOR_SM1_86-2]|nr:MAG: hypothetical protein A7316_02205 [Candidatus Altiarchaeales archaeon WOR_SM1_86-2]